MTGRRAMLGKIVGASAATAAGVFVLPSPPDSPASVENATYAALRGGDAHDHPWTNATIDAEAASPIARYQYAPGRAAGGSNASDARRAAAYEPTSPINVVFPLSDSPADLETAMAVLEEAGWVRRPEEYARYAWDREAESYVLQEATAAQTYFGTNGRLHVRCWEFKGVVSMQAHADSGARPKHAVASYERARRRIESLYAAAGWSVRPAAVDLRNESDPDHDGLATVIEPGDDRG